MKMICSIMLMMMAVASQQNSEEKPFHFEPVAYDDNNTIRMKKQIQ